MSAELHVHTSLAEIPADVWHDLLQSDHPMLQHTFLHGLEHTGCIRAELGWHPHHLVLRQDDRIIAAAPAYLKTNSHGEFVFDHQWAHAFEQAGGRYYPKLLIGVPYSPVTGPRILAQDADAQTLMLEAITQYVAETNLSSAHINFIDASLANRDADAHGYAQRTSDQFFWRRNGAQTFDELLANMRSKKRKAIRKERRDVAAAGITCTRKMGDELSADDIAFIATCYAHTMRSKGNTPALTQAFFAHVCAEMPQQVMAVLAHRDGQPIAMSFCFASRTHLYGRYWGCTEAVSGLHFECCYYQGIEFCLQHGIDTFEPGAGGEHKVARGFLPHTTHSWHHLTHPAFADAVRHALAEENDWRLRYRQQVMEHSPFKSPEPDPSS